jgi:metallo-beta-lactamase class B
MQHFGRRTFIAASLTAVATPAFAADGAPDIWQLGFEGMERVTSTVWVKSLATNLWATSFTFDAGGGIGWIPCNGLIAADAEGPIIVDTGNDREQGEALLAIARRVTGRPVAKAIATHFHGDRTGGGEAMRAANVPIYAHPFSVGLAGAYGLPTPLPVRGLEKEPVAMGPLELFFPGAGHTRDNITVWHGESRTLFGGCLLRATTDNQLGAMSDADPTAFPFTIARLAARYPERQTVIPGHGSAAGDAVAWTAQLLATGALPRNE